MKIKVNLQIFLFIILFYLTKQIENYAIIMLFAFIHELGHMLAGMLLGLKVKTLGIMPFGVSIEFESYEERKIVDKKRIIIALAGPITNALIAITSYFTYKNPIIIYSNILIAIFNLLPIYPLDGGRILKSYIHSKNIEFSKEKNVYDISYFFLVAITAISSILIYYFKNISILFIVIYLWGIFINEKRRFKLKSKVYTIIRENKLEYK